MKLSDSACRGAKPGEKPRKLFDGGGLYLYVKRTGSRLWQMAYRYKGKAKTLSFGAYPAVGLADARQRRLEAKRLLAQGVDPATRRGRLGEAPLGESFEELAREWHGKHYRTGNAKYAERKFTNQVRHRLCPGLPWERDTVTSALRRDAACAA